MTEGDSYDAYLRGERWLFRIILGLIVGAAIMGGCTSLHPTTTVYQPLLLRQIIIPPPVVREWEYPCCLDEDLPETERKV